MTVKPSPKLPPCDFDLVRFAYVLKSRIDFLELSVRQISRLTGCSLRQISHATNGKPICAGATFMLAQLAEIDLRDMLPEATRIRLFAIEKTQQKHGVTASDTCETLPCSFSDSHGSTRKPRAHSALRAIAP